MISENFATSHKPALSKWKWALALLTGFSLGLIADFSSQIIPSVVLGLPLEGITFALVGVIKMVLGLLAVAAGLRVVGLNFRDVGFVTEHIRKDIMIGIGLAAIYTAIQFLIVIPLTGGAEREDIVVESTRIGTSLISLSGFVVLAWTGVFYEEFLFRGLIFRTISESLGNSRIGLVITVLLTAGIFSLLHGYQGVAGMIDTGLFGGLGLTLLYLWRGRRLAAPIVLHALWNMIAPIVIYLWY